MNSICSEVVLRIMSLLKNSEERLYRSKISRESNCTLAHCEITLRRFEGCGVVETKKEGTKIYTALTEKGIQIAEQLILIKGILK